MGGLSGLENDLIPYGMAVGNRAHLSGLNIIGLQRRGFSREDIHALRRAYRLLFAQEGTLLERVEDVAAEFERHPVVQEILEFIRAGGKRSICTPREATVSAFSCAATIASTACWAKLAGSSPRMRRSSSAACPGNSAR